MCNLYTQSKSVDEVASLFRDLQMPLRFPEGIPNLQPRDICITDPAPIVRADGSGGYELVVRRWSWPLKTGKPLYNFRSEDRDFPRGRCLAIADGFYEFTTPADPKRKRKDRWLFSGASDPILGIAALWRDVPEVGEAFTLLTAEPGPDVAPYHGRQIVLLPPSEWRDWLDHARPSKDMLRPSDGGVLAVCPATLD
jgi:putative SOS response-associated peptidase YedK